MSPTIPAVKRIEKARALIQEARDLPVPEVGGKFDFNYVVKVKALLKQARELVQLIPKRAGAPVEIKTEAKKVLEEADQADRDIFH